MSHEIKIYDVFNAYEKSNKRVKDYIKVLINHLWYLEKICQRFSKVARYGLHCKQATMSKGEIYPG
jgi:hypothetical protein